MSEERLNEACRIINASIEAAEARGYRRGVQDAANIAALYDLSIQSMTALDVQARKIEANILALLEQAEPSLSPEDKPA